MLLLDVDDTIQLINKISLPNIFLELRNEIYQDYMNWDDFDKMPRVVNHFENGVIELMPISNNKNYTFKYVNGHPINTKYNLPTIMALGLMADVTTGIPLVISELTIVTALRTATTSAIVAQLVASHSKSMAIIGNGAQSEFQALAFYYLMRINKFKLYDIDIKATYKLVNNLSKYKDIEIIVCSNTREACSDVDIITTITADKTNAIIIDETMIKYGQHINAVGGDCPGKTELSKKILEMSTVFVEYKPQTIIEGEIQQMGKDFIVTELYNIVRNKYIRKEDEITVFDSVGFALEDFSGLNYFYKMSQKYNIGKEIKLIPTQENPKDLFILL